MRNPKLELQKRGYKYAYCAEHLLEVLPKKLRIDEECYFRELALLHNGQEFICYMTTDREILDNKTFTYNKASTAYAACAIYLYDKGLIDLEFQEVDSIWVKDRLLKNLT